MHMTIKRLPCFQVKLNHSKQEYFDIQILLCYLFHRLNED